MTGRMPEQLSEWPVSGLREIFETTIVPRFLTPSRSFKSARERPMVVFVAGQPASQKSRLQQAIVEMVGLEDPVIIDADDFRACHPRYWRWARSYDRTAAARTHDAAAWWVDLAIDFASSHRYDTLVSATFKDPQSAMRKIEPFRQLFDISVVFCAVHEISSGVSVVARYLDQRNRRGFGRYVPLRVHDAACVGVLETAASIEADRSLDLNVYVYRPGLAGGGAAVC